MLLKEQTKKWRYFAQTKQEKGFHILICGETRNEMERNIEQDRVNHSAHPLDVVVLWKKKEEAPL